MAWGAFAYHRLDEVLQRILHKCSASADERARETGLPWPSAEEHDSIRLEVARREFYILPGESWPAIRYRGPVAYDFFLHGFPPDHPHTVRLLNWLVLKFITTRKDGRKYFACIQGLGLPVPDELKGAFEDKVGLLESDGAIAFPVPDQHAPSGGTMISP